jgi:succinoglycan biosynthesis protein ExoM
MHIALCVITYRRLPGLRRLLKSLAGLQFQKTTPEVSVLVVDNDLNGSARSVVDGLAATFPFKLIYDSEPRRGISAARNRAVKIAQDAHFVAFVDDDETVSPDWLEQLLLAQIESAADIVMGPVSSAFEQPPADWIVVGKFFVKNYDKGGKIDEKCGGSGNILIRKSCLGSLAEPFAERFNLTGGADYHLLLKLKSLGAKICWAPKARVTEFVKPNRTNARWILKRRFRVGNTIAMAERSLKSPGMIVRPLKGFLRIFQGMVLLPIALPRGKARVVRTLGLIYFGCGNLAGFCGWRYREYESRKYDHA